jgi:hypothetical protein
LFVTGVGRICRQEFVVSTLADLGRIWASGNAEETEYLEAGELNKSGAITYRMEQQMLRGTEMQ